MPIPFVRRTVLLKVPSEEVELTSKWPRWDKETVVDVVHRGEGEKPTLVVDHKQSFYQDGYQALFDSYQAATGAVVGYTFMGVKGALTLAAIPAAKAVTNFAQAAMHGVSALGQRKGGYAAEGETVDLTAPSAPSTQAD